MGYGAWLGQVAILLLLAVLGVWWTLSANHVALWQEWSVPGRAAVTVWGCYAGLIGLGVVVFGPLTLIRPLVFFSGVALAAWVSRRLEFLPLGVFAWA